MLIPRVTLRSLPPLNEVNGQKPREIAARVLGKRRASEWAPIFDAADCCCSIVQDTRAALADRHFQARGLFSHRLTNDVGAEIAALPVPISSGFRGSESVAAAAPRLGANNAEFGF